MPDAGQRALEIDVRGEARERGLGLVGGSLRRLLPFLAGRVRASREVHRVPELPVHPLGRMVIDADETATRRTQTAVERPELLATGRRRRRGRAAPCAWRSGPCCTP